MPSQQSISQPRLTRSLGRFWTVPNMLSLVRLALIVPITYLIVQDGPMLWLLSLIALAIISDWLDGNVARWFHSESSWGKVLDPLADKVGAGVIAMALTFREAEPNLPVWFLIFILARDAIIVAGGFLLARRTRHVAMSAWIGKIAVTFLALTLLAGILRADQPIMEFMVWSTSALLLYSFLVYAVRFVSLMRKGAMPDLESHRRMEPIDSPERKEDPTLAEETSTIN